MQYRQRGKFDVAIANLRGDGRREGAQPAATCRSSTGATSCSRGTTATRRWRGRGSSPARSASIGCAGRSPIIPRTRISRRFVPGRPTCEAIRHEIWDDNNLGNAIPGATPRAQIDVRTAGAGAADSAGARGRTAAVRTRVRNLSTRPFRRAGQLRPPTRAARRAAVRGRRHAHQSRPRPRVAAGPSRQAASRPTSRSRCPPPPSPGATHLKFDLVSEGIDWFEACGSPTTSKTLLVV